MRFAEDVGSTPTASTIFKVASDRLKGGRHLTDDVMFERKTRLRNRLQAQTFPASWRAILQRNVSYYGRLTPSEREELHGGIQVFIAEKNFEGCGGLEITEIGRASCRERV